MNQSINNIKKDSVHTRVYNDLKNIIRKQIKTVIDDMLTEEITKIDQIDFYYTLIHTSKQILYMNENVVNVYILL